MRPLILKEFRQGRPLLVFSLAVALLLAAAYAVVAKLYVVELAQDNWIVTGGPSPLNAAFSVLILILPLVVAVFAGIGLFAGEADHSTVPVLLALPLSRVRIWSGKIAAGLVLTAIGTVIIVGLSRLVVPRAYASLPVSPYLPDLCLALIFVFSVAAFMSSVTSYTVAAFVATLLIGGALALGIGILWSNLGAPLLGYDPILDVALWGLLVAPALLFASALAISRGELLQSLRKHAFGIPALLVGLLITLVIVGGVARAATRYSRSRVQAISPIAESAGPSVLALIAQGDPVPYERAPLGCGGWRRRGPESVPVAYPQPYWGGEPSWRSNYGVVLDLKTGRELVRVRSGYNDHAFRLSISPDSRFAAATTGPAGLTWGVQSWKHFPETLEIWDLSTHRRLFSDVPAPLVKRDSVSVGDLKWSARGDYLAFTTIYGAGDVSSVSGFYAMKRDGSEVRDLAVKPSWDGWAWSPTENVIFALDRGRIYRVTLDGKAPKALWTSDESWPLSKRSLAAASPDGQWLVLTETRDVSQQENTEIRAVTVRVVRTDGSGSLSLRSWTPVPHRLHQPDQEDRMVGTAQVHLAWSSQGSALYALVTVDQKVSQLYRWRPDDPSLAAVGPELPYGSATLAALPRSSEMLVWPYAGWRAPATHGAFTLNANGKTRPVPSATEGLEFANENSFVTIDEAGRLITLAGPPDHQTIRATDLETGKSERVYP